MQAILSKLNFTIHVIRGRNGYAVFELILKAPLELVAAMLALRGVSAYRADALEREAPSDESEMN